MSFLALEGKKIFVTGGSRGIGAATVKTLANFGAQVAFTYSSNEQAAKNILNELPGEGHKIISMNLADESSVMAAMDELLKHFSNIDGVVNNAGITKDQLLLRMKTEDFDAVLDTNLKGNFLIIKALSKVMMKARKGSIVNITSVIGQTGNAGQSNYAASKAGLIGFSKSIAQELGSRNLRVNCVAPGFISTDMTDSLTEEQKKQILTKIPLETLGTAQDVANAIAFLLSDASKYISGHTLNVNGGMYMS